MFKIEKQKDYEKYKIKEILIINHFYLTVHHFFFTNIDIFILLSFVILIYLQILFYQ